MHHSPSHVVITGNTLMIIRFTGNHFQLASNSTFRTDSQYLGGDCMIPFSRDEIMSRSAGILAVLQILRKLYLVITYKNFHPGKAEILLLNSWEEIFPCNRFSSLKRDEQVN